MSTDVPLELGDVAVQGHKESSLSIALLHAAALRAKPLCSLVAGVKNPVRSWFVHFQGPLGVLGWARL